MGLSRSIISMLKALECDVQWKNENHGANILVKNLEFWITSTQPLDYQHSAIIKVATWLQHCIKVTHSAMFCFTLYTTGVTSDMHVNVEWFSTDSHCTIQLAITQPIIDSDPAYQPVSPWVTRSIHAVIVSVCDKEGQCTASSVTMLSIREIVIAVCFTW